MNKPHNGVAMYGQTQGKSEQGQTVIIQDWSTTTAPSVQRLDLPGEALYAASAIVHGGQTILSVPFSRWDLDVADNLSPSIDIKTEPEGLELDNLVDTVRQIAAESFGVATALINGALSTEDELDEGVVVSIHVPVARDVYKTGLEQFYTRATVATASLDVPITVSVVRVS